MRQEINILKKEIDTLKDSNENHIFINEKLNKALKRSELRSEQLQQKLKSTTEQSVLLKKQVSIMQMKGKDQENKGDKGGFGEFFDGDVSSIMVKADMIDDLNIAE